MRYFNIKLNKKIQEILTELNQNNNFKQLLYFYASRHESLNCFVKVNKEET